MLTICSEFWTDFLKFNNNQNCNRDSQEDANRGKPNWEHLSDELHVLITVEDTENRAQKKLERAVEEVQKLLIPVSFLQTVKNKQWTTCGIFVCRPSFHFGCSFCHQRRA